MIQSRLALPLLLLCGCCARNPESVKPAARQMGFESEGAASAISTHSGDWKIVEVAGPDGSGHVLSQLAKNASPVFNVALFEGFETDDVDIQVSFNSVAGEIDQGGGPIWRAVDGENYYIARYNPLEDNYRVYTVVKGVRTELASVDIPASPGWHSLRVRMVGNHIQCSYDGKQSLDVTDDTFVGEGQLGLWTKADAQTEFDNVVIR